MRLIIFIVLLCGLSIQLPAGAGGNPDAILGTWLVQEKDGQVQVYKCGNKYCAKIVWLERPTDEQGQPRKDTKNPNPALRSRTLINSVFLENFSYDAKANEWSGGSVYDSRSGKSYTAYVKLNANGTLTLTGYVLGMRWLSRSNTWTRVN